MLHTLKLSRTSTQGGYKGHHGCEAAGQSRKHEEIERTVAPGGGAASGEAEVGIVEGPLSQLRAWVPLACGHQSHRFGVLRRPCVSDVVSD